MKKLIYITLIVATALNINCASTKDTSRKSVFTFSYKQQQFEIVSLSTVSGEGTNIIKALNEDNSSEQIARDLNQDGTIDLVIKGSLSLEEFDYIYKTGIRIAQLSGKYTEREPLRRFEWQHEQYNLVVSTYLDSIDEIKNVFYIQLQADMTEHIYTDFFSNGKLDALEKGTINTERAQQLYEMTLLKGLDENRITFESERYIVKDKRTFWNKRDSEVLSSIH